MEDSEFIKRVNKYIIIGGIFSLAMFLLFLYKVPIFDLSAPVDTKIFSDYGALIAGTVGVFFSLISILFIIQNLRDQDKNFKAQDRNFSKQQVGNRFFELMRIQRDNSENVSIECIDGTRKGRKVFIYLLDEFYVCYERVSTLRDHTDIGEREGINLAYLAFFYGTDGDSSKEVLKKRFSLMSMYDDAFVDNFFRVFKFIPHVTKKSDIPYKLFQGHQSRLGHYYRHYFQAVNYIDDESILSEDDKYGYIKTLRAQFSTHEQVLFFLDSLSDLGLAWELGQTDQSKKLITKYNLIKNIPEGFIRGIDPKKYYPRISYEGTTRRNMNE